MKLSVIFGLVLVACCAFRASGDVFQEFDRIAFYRIMEDGKLVQIEDELSLLASVGIPERQAYEGALLMRKSGLVSVASQKLRFFKEGRIKLETAIATDTARAEYYFLRLIIEEHAPKIVKYQRDLHADKQRVVRSYPTLSPVVQQAIINYSKQSSVLHPQDF